MGDYKISQLQLISIGGCYLLGTIVVAVFVSAVAGNESWLVGLLGGICFIPTLLIYFSLLKKFPGKNLFQMHEIVFGRVAGRILSGVYLLFFLSMCALNIMEASNFLHYFLMPGTPQIVLAIFFMAACVYCARKGFGPVARVSTIFGIVAIASLLFNGLLAFNHSNFAYLLPVCNMEPLTYVQSAHIAVSLPFGESIVLMMFASELDQKASMKKVYICLSIITVLVMTAVHMREVISLGPMISYATLPSFEAVRMINIAGILSRTESIFALVLVSLTFFKTLILFHACAKGTQQIFRLDSYKHLLVMLGVLLVVYATGVYNSPSDDILWGKNVSPFIWLFFTSLLPLLMLLTACIRRALAKRKKGAMIP